LVAKTPARDLLLRAKHLLVAAIDVITGSFDAGPPDRYDA
jgi:hypothetical protein